MPVTIASSSPASNAATRAASTGMNLNSSPSDGGSSPQYPSNFSTTTLSDGTHSTNLNGPVPTGLREKFAASAAAVGDTITPTMKASVDGNAVHGSLTLSVSVSGSTTSTAVSGSRLEPL